MTVDDIKFAMDKKYTDFSTAVKTELKQKLATHPEIETYKSDFEKIQDMKNLFSQVIGASNNQGE